MKNKVIEYVLIGIGVILVIILCTRLATREVKAEPTLKKVTATAYYDSYGHGYGADGRKLVAGLTIAGRVQDMGKTAILYDEDYHLIGIYEFRDTGYGKETGIGSSRILPGRTMGDIETGEAVDIYMYTKQECMAWGRKTVYLQIVNAKG